MPPFPPASGRRQQDYTDFFADVAGLLGTRMPGNRRARSFAPSEARLEPLLTASVSPRILYGYGDPWVLHTGGNEPWLLVATSNDAPDAFPLLRSKDLKEWRLDGFAFPEGCAPPWTMTGPGSDFWAPEIRRVGERFVLCFAARDRAGALAIGLAEADRPEGPWRAHPEPLLTGGVIDPHVFVSRSGETWLFWKADTNAVWPSLLCALLHREPRLGGSLFASDEDRRTARLYSGLWPSIAPLPPMERFSALQLLIEAATADYSGLKGRLAAHPEIVEAMRTPILGRRLDSDTLSLAGDEVQVLENDLAWEGPLIEGMCLIERDGRYFLFYSGNDFSTAEYGIGYAVADWVEGPYRKRREPLVRSNAQWWGPGHPSIAQGPDGEPILFMHAYPPGKAAYKAFRALLAAGLRFDGERVEIVPPAL